MCLGCHTSTSNQRTRFRHDFHVDFADRRSDSTVKALERRAPRAEEHRDEVHAADLREPGDARGVLRRRASCRAEMNAYVDGLRKVRRARRRRGARRPVDRPRGSHPERRARGHRRPVHGGQGVLRRLHDRRLRRASSGRPRSHAATRRFPPRRGDGGPAADGRRRLRGLTAPWRRTRVEGLLRRLAPEVLGVLAAPPPPVRRVRGRRPGGAPGRRAAVAVGWRAGASARVADHGRLTAADRRLARRACAARPRGGGLRGGAARPSSARRRPATRSRAATTRWRCCSSAATRRCRRRRSSR